MLRVDELSIAHEAIHPATKLLQRSLRKFNNIIYASRFAMCLIHKSGLIAWIGEGNNQLFGHFRCFIDERSWGEMSSDTSPPGKIFFGNKVDYLTNNSFIVQRTCQSSTIFTYLSKQKFSDSFSPSFKKTSFCFLL